jgi:hypothetical protein
MSTNKQKRKSAPASTDAPEVTKRHRDNEQGDYTTLPDLTQQHYAMLKASAISDEVIKERGYRTIINSKDLQALGFSPVQERVPGLLLPLHSTDGQTPLYVYRPDYPRVIEDKKHREADGQYKQKVIKYEMPKGAKMRLDVPLRCLTALGDPKIPLHVTEGIKKGDALASTGLCTVDVLGVWNFLGTNDKGGKVFLPDWRDIALNDRLVRIVFDSDVTTKPEVKKALDELTRLLQSRGAKVQIVNLPGGKNKVGIDDWLAEGHTVEDLEELVEGPRSALKIAPPVVELLDSAPLSIRRPLCLVDGNAYAAAWPYMKTIQTQKQINGRIIQLKEPEEIKEQSLHIVRGDGAIFGPASTRPLSSLGVDVALEEQPTAKDALWSTPGIKSFEKGYRPDPKDVFNRVKSVIARFIDFDRSLADQETMSEMLSCFAISTWFLDAFSVAPYIWANGERGSGKTSLLFTLVRLSYLGVPLSPSGSFAALRDLADYGATLGLDDAEDLTDPKKSDPDKRAILLSGNRRGITVHLKEPNPNGQGWKTREVNCYCPRIFSTIQKPDATLSSRAIIIPVVRTAQRSKGNADPLDDMQWPCDRQKLVDDLWSMALAYLPELPIFDKLVGEKSKLIGRDLQPWRAILTIAAWLDSMGVSSLWGKIESLAAGTYQDERIDLEKVDINRIAMFALGEYAARTPTKVEWLFPTQAIVDIMHRIIDDDEIEIEKSYINSRMMGHRFSKMRLGKDLNQRPRQWKMSRSELVNRFTAYRIPIPDEILKNLDTGLGLNGENGNNGNNGDIPAISSIVANNELEQKAIILPKTPCYACKSTAWYIGQAGNVLCGVCHPAPALI